MILVPNPMFMRSGNSMKLCIISLLVQKWPNSRWPPYRNTETKTAYNFVNNHDTVLILVSIPMFMRSGKPMKLCLILLLVQKWPNSR